MHFSSKYIDNYRVLMNPQEPFPKDCCPTGNNNQCNFQHYDVKHNDMPCYNLVMKAEQMLI